MKLSDLIASFILDTLSSTNGCAELQRAEIAQRFGCVPSQVNYVISTRFSPEHGYIVESRRGGGGYIRITRVEMDREELFKSVVESIGDDIDIQTIRAFTYNLLEADVLSECMAEMILSATSDTALRIVPLEHRDSLRAGIMRQMLISALRSS